MKEKYILDIIHTGAHKVNNKKIKKEIKNTQNYSYLIDMISCVGVCFHIVQKFNFYEEYNEQKWQLLGLCNIRLEKSY